MSEEKKIATTEPQPNQKFEWRKWINSKWVVKNVPFFLFLALLAVLYIYNGHYSDKLSIKISNAEKHIKDLEYEYKTIKSDVIFRSKASELAKVVEPLGLRELKTPPVVLKDSVKNN